MSGEHKPQIDTTIDIGENETLSEEIRPSQPLRITNKLVPFVFVLGIGTVAFLLGEKCGIEYSRDEGVRLVGEEEFDFIIGPFERADQIDETSVSFELDRWQVTKNSYQQTFKELVNYYDFEELIKPVRSIAVNHTLYGAELLSRADKSLEIGVAEEAGVVKIDDLVFDLTKPLDFHLATAIIDTQITLKKWTEIVNSKESVISQDPVDVDRIKKTKLDLTYLRYLKEEVNNFYFTQESFLFVPTDLLVAHGKIIQTLERHQLPLPKTTIFTKEVNTDAGQYISHDYLNSPFTVIIRGNTSSQGVIHEFGHFLSDSSHYEKNTKTEELSLKNYQQVVESARLIYEKEVVSPENEFAWKIVEDNIGEDYAETFAWYFFRGDDFRAKLDELAFNDQASLVILKTKYDFFKNIVFQGEEFHNEGVSLTYKSEFSSTVKQDFQVGDIVKIVDEDPQNPGVLLRPVASYNQDRPDLLAVFNGDEVETIAGPRTIIYIGLSEDGSKIEEKTVNWWKVKISRQTIDSYALVGNIEGEGWIQERWFGEKIQSKSTP